MARSPAVALGSPGMTRPTPQGSSRGPGAPRRPDRRERPDARPRAGPAAPPAARAGRGLRGRGRAGCPRPGGRRPGPRRPLSEGSRQPLRPIIWRAGAGARAEGPPQPPAGPSGSRVLTGEKTGREEGGGKLGSGPRSRERGSPGRCPRLMNMQEPPPSLRDVTGRPGVSAGAAPGPSQ